MLIRKWRQIGGLGVLCFFLQVQGLFAQGSADSLIRYVEKNQLEDSVKIKLYGDISWELMGIDINKSLQYANRELELSLKTGRTADQAQSYSDIGNVFNRMGTYDSALIYYNKALELRRKLKQPEKEAGILTNYATVLMRQNKFSEALNINFQTLKLFEGLGNKLKQANVLGNIGNIYYELNQNASAEKFLRRGLRLAQEEKAIVPLGNILVNLGGIKFDQNELDSALFYFGEAEKIMVDNGLLYNLAAVYNNIGKIWCEKKDYDKALTYYKKALANREELQDNFGVGLCYMNIGETLLKQGHTTESITLLQKAEKIFKPLHALMQQKQVYAYLAQAEEKRGDYKAANEYFQLYAAYKDSLYTKDNAEKMAEMQTRFETEKKDLEIAKQQAELSVTKAQVARKNTINILLISSVIFVILFSWLLYNRRTLKQRAQLDAEMLRQQDLRAKAVIDAEEKERMRIARDLHDGVGQTLSAAKMNLSSLQSQLGDNGSESALLLKNALDLVDDSVKEVRQVSHSMMPNALLKLGLAAAVREFINKLSGVGNLKIDLEINGLTERLEQSRETVLFRVLQEIVSNIIRHAQANHISIQLIRHEDEVTLTVEDNGIGFDTSRIKDAAGIGLKNIFSRIEFLNGTVHYDSTPGRGTTVMIEVPVVEQK